MIIPLGRPMGGVSHTHRIDGNLEIYVQPLDGPAVNVTRNEAIDNFPAWTPEGRIGFVSNRDGGFDVYSTRPNDSSAAGR